MKIKKSYTTGEVASILNVTRATVSRKFDNGEFEGSKNPVTSERLISHDSLMQFLTENHIPYPLQHRKKSILVVSEHPTLLAILHTIQQGTEDVALTYCTHTTDALIHCGRNVFDIIILDHSTDDLNTDSFRNSLERMNAIHSSNILHVLAETSPQNFHRHLNDFTLNSNDMDESRVKRLLHKLLYTLPEDVTAQRWLNRRYHARQSQRVDSTVPIEFTTSFEGNTAGSAHGTGIMRNISTGGALISDLQCEDANDLLSSFTLQIDATSGTNRISQLNAEIVRLSRNRNLCAGVRFIDPSAPNKKAINSIINNII